MKKLLFLVLALATASMSALSFAPPRPQGPTESDADYAAYKKEYNEMVSTATANWQKQMQSFSIPK